MFTKEEIAANWNRIKGRIRETWGQLTDDELQKARGSTEQLIGTIQAKTGVARHEVEKFVDNIVHEASGITEQVAQTAREYASSAADAVYDGYQQAQRRTAELGDQMAQTVSYRPLESLAIAFGVGVLAGILVSMGRRTA
jgi:uncharacterized protein YjbJ (UPF0337 family)